MDFFISFIKAMSGFFDIISNWILPVGAIIVFFSREKIKNYFNRDIVTLKEEYRIDFEKHKNELSRHSEILKLDIDVQRKLSTEVQLNRLKVYHKTVAILRRFIRLTYEYNGEPGVGMQNSSFSRNKLVATEHLDYIEENYLYYSDEISTIQRNVANKMSSILKAVRKSETVDKSLIDDFNSELKKLKTSMMNEILSHKPSVKMSEK